jgi:hypothetical protein
VQEFTSTCLSLISRSPYSDSSRNFLGFPAEILNKLNGKDYAQFFNTIPSFDADSIQFFRSTALRSIAVGRSSVHSFQKKLRFQNPSGADSLDPLAKTPA